MCRWLDLYAIPYPFIGLSHWMQKEGTEISDNRNHSSSRSMEISGSTLLLPTLPSAPHQSSVSSCNSLFFNNGGRAFLMKKANTMVLTRSRAQRGLNCRCLFGLGVPELVVIAGVAALLFGPKKLPEVGRSIGKTVKSFQQAAKEFETELKKEPAGAGEVPAEKPTPVSEGERDGEKGS